VTCTGFSGADISGFLGDPTKLFTKPENPDFFLNMPGALDSLPSPECLLDGAELSILVPDDFSLTRVFSVDEKLADWRNDEPIVLVSDVEWDSDRDSGGGAGRGVGWLWLTDDFVASMRLRIAVPSKGAPISSADVFELRGRGAPAELE